MKLYKLTDQDGLTHGDMAWGEGVTNEADSTVPAKLCTEGVIHAYIDPLLAVLLNPVHANFSVPRMWEAEGDVTVNDGLKVGCRKLTTTREVSVPEVTTEQRVKFAIACGVEVFDDRDFTDWVDEWLSGLNQTVSSAERVWHKVIGKAGSSTEHAPQAEAAGAAILTAIAAAGGELPNKLFNSYRDHNLVSALVGILAASTAELAKATSPEEIDLVDIAKRVVSG